VSTKLAVIAGVGVLASVAVAGFGVRGLGTVDTAGRQLSDVAVTLQAGADLRDMEGDMRVALYETATATDATSLKHALAEVKDTDGAVDEAVAAVRSGLSAAHDPSGTALLDAFVARLSTWRGIRNEQVVPAVETGDAATAAAIVAGPLQDANDGPKGFAAPLDDLFTRLQRQVGPADAEAAAAYSASRLEMVLALAVGALSAVVLALCVGRMIVRPLRAVSAALDRLAEGDLTQASGVSQRDEVGRMAASLDVARASLRQLLAEVVNSADAVSASSQELSASSAQIAASAEETSAQSGVVAGTADEVSRSVQTVAAGAEQMGASIREIASNAAEASEVANKAVSAAATTTATVAKLGESSAEIGNVVKVITGIAEQTNLLALNATIEAARAGEAGKGFAVVAGEVKDLAQQTANATEDIARRINAIQTTSAEASTAIGRIGQVINEINAHQGAIAAAVEEQTATTNEMNRNVAEAAGGTGQIAENITSVSTAADSTTQALTQTRTAVDELSRMSADLRTTVGRFTY